MKLLKLKKILAVSLLLNAAYACAAPGDWDLSPWSYTNGPVATNPATSTVTTSSIASQGTPSVNIQVNQTASGSLSRSGGLPALGLSGAVNSSFSGILNNQAGPVPTTNQEVVEINYSPTLATFGPAAAQGNAFPGGSGGKSGFSLRRSPPPPDVSGSTVTIALSGGAVFDAVGGTATSRFQQTAGGVGANFVTYTWNPLAPAVGTSLFLNGLVINGPVDKITITQDTTTIVTAPNTINSQTTLYATRINPAALLLVSPQPDIATGVMGAPLTPINVLGNDTSNGQPATPTNSTLQVGTDANTTAAANAGVVLDPSTGQITSTAATPPGTYVITYTLCDKSLPPACANTTATVTIAGTGAPQPDTGTAAAGAPMTPVNVLANDTTDGVPSTPGNSTLTVVTPASNPGVMLDPATGLVTTTAAVPPGTYTITYQLCDKATPPTCATSTVTVTVAGAAAPQPDTVTATAGTPVTPVNVLANDTTDGVPSTLGNSTLTVVTPASNPGVVLDPATGLVTTTAAVPPGTYTITYQLCDKATPPTCATSTVTVTVAGAAAPQPDTVTATAGTPVTPVNVLANDTTDGVPSTLGNSTLTVVTPASNPGVVLDPATGLVTTTAAVPPGTYTITYQLCNKAVPAVCATATVTLTVNDKNASVSTPVPVNALWAIVLMGLATAAAFVRIRSKV